MKILAEITINDSNGRETLYFASTAKSVREARDIINRRLAHAFQSGNTRRERDNWQEINVTIKRRNEG